MFDFDRKTGELFLYDEITPSGYGGIDAGTVKEALDTFGPKDITVRINSDGGSLQEGVAIFNMLTRHKGEVTTINDSVAASIANYIFMAGDNRLVAPNSMSMIHAPWTLAMGNADELRKTADLLDQARETIQSVYQEKMGLSAKKVEELMAGETWYKGNEAVQAKMATGIGLERDDVEPIPIAAGRFKHTPAALMRGRDPGSKTVVFPRLRHWEHEIAKVSAKYDL